MIRVSVIGERQGKLGAWLVVVSVATISLLVGVSTGRPAMTSLGEVSRSPSSTTTSQVCGSLDVLSGLSVRHGSVLDVFTNGLVEVSSCDSEVVLMLRGSEVEGRGPAVSVTWLTEAGTLELVWSGFASANEFVEMVIPASTTAYISFTNDVATGTEDRNLRIEAGER